MFLYKIRFKMDQKGHEMDNNGMKYMEKGFWDLKYLFFVQFF